MSSPRKNIIPDLNDSLKYVDGLVSNIEALQNEADNSRNTNYLNLADIPIDRCEGLRDRAGGSKRAAEDSLNRVVAQLNGSEECRQ